MSDNNSTLGKYARVQILATRVEQLNRGAPTQVEWQEGVDDTYTIALRELEQGKIPIEIMTRARQQETEEKNARWAARPRHPA